MGPKDDDMNRPSYRLAFASVLALSAATLWQRSASANGRFPAADQLILNPTDPTHIVVRTTFGFVESHDSGKTWLWTCEELIGRIQAQDPPFTVTGDGSLVVAVPFEGVSVSHDRGCSWTRAEEPLTGQLAVDVTREPNDPAAMVVLTSTNDTPMDAGAGAPQEFRSLVVETKDNGRTWALLGVPLARDFIAATIEFANTDPQRIYTSGVFGDPMRRGAIERSEDGGKTWTRSVVPTPPDVSSVYISGVDPRNADRIYVRVLGQPDMATSQTPTTLLVSSDKGNTWKEIAKTPEGMLGFALSPDGSEVAYGTIGQGLMIGPWDSSAFKKVSDVQNRCLTWTDAGLYACGTDLGVASDSPDPPTNFGVALSRDKAATFEKLFRLSQTCPVTCPDDSKFNKVCRATWEMIPGVTTTIGATGEKCTVDWAKKVVDGGRSDATGGSGGAGGGGTGGNAGSSGGFGDDNVKSESKCSCRIVGFAGDEMSARTLGLGVVIGLVLRRRAKRFARPSGGRTLQR